MSNRPWDAHPTHSELRANRPTPETRENWRPSGGAGFTPTPNCLRRLGPRWLVVIWPARLTQLRDRLLHNLSTEQQIGRLLGR